MNSKTPQSSTSKNELSTIQGQIERVRYYNDETEYTVARMKVPGYRELVTVVGTIMAPVPGQVLRASGSWSNHPKFGEQFRIVQYTTLVPATVAGIEKYLGSGLIKGIGPVLAKRIVHKFGKNSLDVIEESGEKLGEVEGIGSKRVAIIQKAWSDQKDIREVMLFLQGNGVSSAYAAKIFKQYGTQSIDVVKENPYRLAMDIFGIGFVTADKIAANLGFGKDSPLRAEAGIIYVLNQLANEGNVYYPRTILCDKCCEILEVELEIVHAAIESLSSQRRIVIDHFPPESSDNDSGSAVYLSPFYHSESGIAESFKRLLLAPFSRRMFDSDKALEWVQSQLSISLADSQKQAVRSAIENKVLVITGGPGTGKTTIINAVVKIFTAGRIRILLSAPTGRAAKRMTEATGHEAKTIHRLLEFSFQKGGFQKNEEHPLNCDLLIIDEASMIDTVLMYHLLKAVRSDASLILVGDVNQLPSVGPGNVLNDIISSESVPVVRLTEIFRQAKESAIIVNAHLINKGVVPSFDRTTSGPTDFYLIEKDEPEEALKTVLQTVTGRIERAFGFTSEDVQVLTPMNRGTLGVGNLNVELQKVLNPREDAIFRGGKGLRIKDKVMQIVNNYDKEVYNGDIGTISQIDAEAQEVTIVYDSRPVIYDYSELDEIVLAYAVSIHKSQGSEYSCVVIPLLTQHYMMLQRNLLYTAVTRGKKLVIIVGSRKALAIGVKNDKTQKRYTDLARRLRGN